MKKIAETAPEIEAFISAFSEMKKASSALDKVVSPVLKGATEDELSELADVLPKQYRGVRRVYQRMIELSDETGGVA